MSEEVKEVKILEQVLWGVLFNRVRKLSDSNRSPKVKQLVKDCDRLNVIINELVVVAKRQDEVSRVEELQYKYRAISQQFKELSRGMLGLLVELEVISPAFEEKLDIVGLEQRAINFEVVSRKSPASTKSFISILVDKNPLELTDEEEKAINSVRSGESNFRSAAQGNL